MIIGQKDRDPKFRVGDLIYSFNTRVGDPKFRVADPSIRIV